jgi:hypothetical protein
MNCFDFFVVEDERGKSKTTVSEMTLSYILLAQSKRRTSNLSTTIPPTTGSVWSRSIFWRGAHVIALKLVELVSF